MTRNILAELYPDPIHPGIVHLKFTDSQHARSLDLNDPRNRAFLAELITTGLSDSKHKRDLLDYLSPISPPASQLTASTATLLPEESKHATKVITRFHLSQRANGERQVIVELDGEEPILLNPDDPTTIEFLRLNLARSSQKADLLRTLRSFAPAASVSNLPSPSAAPPPRVYNAGEPQFPHLSPSAPTLEQTLAPMPYDPLAAPQPKPSAPSPEANNGHSQFAHRPVPEWVNLNGLYRLEIDPNTATPFLSTHINGTPARIMLHPSNRAVLEKLAPSPVPHQAELLNGLFQCAGQPPSAERDQDLALWTKILNHLSLNPSGTPLYLSETEKARVSHQHGNLQLAKLYDKVILAEAAHYIVPQANLPLPGYR